MQFRFSEISLTIYFGISEINGARAGTSIAPNFMGTVIGREAIQMAGKRPDYVVASLLNDGKHQGEQANAIDRLAAGAFGRAAGISRQGPVLFQNRTGDQREIQDCLFAQCHARPRQTNGACQFRPGPRTGPCRHQEPAPRGCTGWANVTLRSSCGPCLFSKPRSPSSCDASKSIHAIFRCSI